MNVGWVFLVFLVGCTATTKVEHRRTSHASSQDAADLTTDQSIDNTSSAILPGRIVIRMTETATEVTEAEGESPGWLAPYLPVDRSFSSKPLFAQGEAPQLRIASTPTDLSSYLLIEVPGLNLEETKQAVEQMRDDDVDAYHDYRVEAHTLQTQDVDPFQPPQTGSWGQGFADMWGWSKVGADRLTAAQSGEGVTIAIIDTGVDAEHEDLGDRVIAGFNYVSTNNDTHDDNGHGTHVAGIASASKNNGVGIAGVAPAAQILAIKVLNENGSGFLTNVAAGIDYARRQNAGVINLSLGAAKSITKIPPYMKDAVKAAYGAGIVIVSSAGNAGTNVINNTPANDPRVLAVGSVDQHDLRSSFSNFGPRVAIFAPGGGGFEPSGAYRPHYSILSLASSSHGFHRDLIVGDHYARLGGTSMAAPFVAGLAALMKQRDSEVTSAQVEQALRRGSLRENEPDWISGRLDVTKALAVTDPLGVQITTPLYEVLSQQSYDLTGTIVGESLRNWKIERRFEGVDWKTLAEGTNPVSDDVLATWNTRIYPNNRPGTLRLTAWDTEGVPHYDAVDINFHTPGDGSYSAVKFVSPEQGQCGKVFPDQACRLTITLRNVGLVNPIEFRASLQGEEFAFAGGSYPGTGGTCAQTLESDATCSMVIDLIPSDDTYALVEETLTVTFWNEDQDRETVQIDLTAERARARPLLMIKEIPGQFDFGTIDYTQKKDVTLTVENIGVLEARTFFGRLHHELFDFVGGSFPGTTGTCTDRLPAGESCLLVIRAYNNFFGKNDEVIGNFRLHYAHGAVSYQQGWYLNASRRTQAGILAGGDISGSLPWVFYRNKIDYTVRIGNEGDTPLVVGNLLTDSSISYQGGIFPGTNGTCPTEIQPGQWCDLGLTFRNNRFTPSYQNHTVDVGIRYHNGWFFDSLNTKHEFVIVTPAKVVAAASELDMGAIDLGSESRHTLVLKNEGPLDAIEFDIQLDASFTATLEHNCTSLKGAELESCNVTIVAQPKPGETLAGDIQVTYTDIARRDEAVSLLIPVTGTVGRRFPWHNFGFPEDTDQDGIVTPHDALVIINRINQPGGEGLLDDSTPREEVLHRFDVNRDGWLTPADALQVINFLNQGQTGE